MVLRGDGLRGRRAPEMGVVQGIVGRSRSVAATFAVLTCLAATAGCDAGSERGLGAEASLGGYDRSVIGKPLDEVAPGDVPADYESVMRAFFPLHSYFYDGITARDAELATRRRQFDTLSSCMAERGWAGAVSGPTEGEVDDDLYSVYFGTRLASPAVRQNVGYGYFVPLLKPQSDDAPFAGTLTDDFYASNNECVRLADEETQQAALAWETYASIVVGGMEPYYEAVVEGRDEVAQCLLTEGFPEDPQEGFEPLWAQYVGSEGGADADELERLAGEERAAVDAEWECYRQHGLLPYLRYNLAEQTGILEGYPEVMAEIRQDLRRALE